MIWATVSSQSCCCWLYRASPSLTAKNILSLISVLSVWWCPCGVVSCWRVFAVTGASSWQNSVSLPCFSLYSKARFACYSRCLLISYFCIPVLYNERTSFWVLVLEGLVGLDRTIQLQLLQHWGIDLDYCDIKWFALEMNRSFCRFWDCTDSNCLTFVDYEGYFISVFQMV